MPNAPTGVATAYAASGVDIEVTWNEPSNNGATLTAYKIEIKRISDSSY